MLISSLQSSSLLLSKETYASLVPLTYCKDREAQYNNVLLPARLSQDIKQLFSEDSLKIMK